MAKKIYTLECDICETEISTQKKEVIFCGCSNKTCIDNTHPEKIIYSANDLEQVRMTFKKVK